VAGIAAELTDSRKRLILIACILGSSVVTVDGTVVNVALPAIRGDLGGGFAGQQWVSNGYLVTLSALILIGGSLGDVFGERRIFEIGVGLFGITSLLCAAAPTIELLVAARALQGVAGALVTPAALAVIVAVFPPAERGKAVGSWTAWLSIGTVLGPLIGGQLVDVASWRWIFLINLPLVLFTLLMIARYVPEARERPADPRVDFVGATLCAVGLAGMTFGLIRQPEVGFGDPTVLGPLAGGAFLFASFLAYERRASHPMLKLELFRSRNFSVGNLQTLCMYAGLSLLFFFLTLYLQQVAGFSALKAGTTGLPITLTMFFLAARFGALADRFGPRLFMALGPALSAAGLLLLTRLGRNVDFFPDLLPALIIFALGLSMTVAPLTATVLSGADERNAGVASGVNNAIARAAGLVGVAAVGAVVAVGFGARVDDGLKGRQLSPPVRAAVEASKGRPLAQPELPRGVSATERRTVNTAVDDASTGAFHLGMTISAALVALGGVMSAVGIRNPKRRVEAADCPGGQLAGQPKDAARQSPCDWNREPLPVVSVAADPG
jgi:EmrB/QacA subfamily drug resistance transporter